MRNLVVLSIFVLFAVGGVYAEMRIPPMKRIEKRAVPAKIEKNLLEQAKDMIKRSIKKQLKGTLVTIAGSTLTVEKNGESYTINTAEDTELRSKFGAESRLSDFNPKDTLIILGKQTSSGEIDASYIRNLTMQRRTAVFVGEVIEKADNTLTVKTVGRGNITVHISSVVRYTEQKNTITYSDIEIGNKIIIRGELWNRESSNIDARIILKIASHKPTPAPTRTTD
ncbi:MAG: hypothetical protein WA061_03665 [Microgenomates group bacterium]